MILDGEDIWSADIGKPRASGDDPGLPFNSEIFSA